MSTITTRAGKGSPLTNNEVDANFTNLNTDKAELSGAAFTGAITTTSTVDGRDVATDGTKLDGIEASADVTDTANVTAAGALMDSELTSEASVKALNQGVATSDSPTFAGLNASGDLTLDVAGDIILDADGADVILKDGGTGFLEIDKDGDNARLKNPIADGDIKIQGIDGASTITALTLDMSAAGAATFNAGVTVGGNSTFNAPNINITADDARLLIEEADGTDIVWLGDITGAGVGGCFLYNHGGTATTQLRADSASTIGHGLDVTGTATMDGLVVDTSAGQLDVEALGGSSVKVKSSGSLKLQGTGGSVDLINGSTEVLSTTSTGIDVTGTATMDGLTVDGNVGIGGSTITDVNLLNIQGSGASKNIGVVFNDTNTSKIFAIQNGGSALKFFDYTASAERMRIDSSGNVGIGTSSPSANLEIAQSGNNVGLLVAGGGYNYTAKFESSDAEANIIIEDSNSTNDGNMIGVATNDMYFITNASERLRIDASGNVGIGISNPSDYYTNFNSLVLGNTSAASGMTIASGTTHDGTLAFADGTSGTAEYSGYIQYSHGTDSLSVGTAGTERMRIDSVGSVGIGNAPSTWASTVYDALQIGGSIGVGTIAGRRDGINQVNFGLNWNYDGGATLTYVGTSFATNYAQEAGTHRWFSAASGTAGAALTFSESMRIDQYGGLVIKSVNGATTAGFYGGNLVNGITAVPTPAGTPFVLGRDTGTLRSAHFGGNLKFDSGYGVQFSVAGGTGTSTSGTLDDYEEGTWTPTIIGGTTSTTFSGRYTKIGRMVYANFYSGGFAITNASGAASIGGLPFTVKSTGDGYGASATFTHVTCFSDAIQTGYCNAGTNYVYPTPAASTATTTFSNSSLVYLMMSVAYEAA